MARQQRVTATVKMTYNDDADLIAWWNSIPRGQRNAVMKQAMRAFITGDYQIIVPTPVVPAFDVSRLSDDIAWMRDALSELPGYVERVLQTSVVVHHNPVPAHHEADEQAVRRREERMRKKQW